MRGTFRIPAHQPLAPTRPTEEEEPAGDETVFFDRECYEFNPQLRVNLNDRYCSHCRHYLTARCPHIDEFLEDVEDLNPE